MKVMIVDDDETITEFVTWALSDEGHDVFAARNGAVALEALEKVTPDVILLDMRMPVMDGWQFAREYRSRHEQPSPIVVLTAAKDASQRAEEIGANGHLAKPFTLTDLLATLERFAPNGSVHSA